VLLIPSCVQDVDREIQFQFQQLCNSPDCAPVWKTLQAAVAGDVSDAGHSNDVMDLVAAAAAIAAAPTPGCDTKNQQHNPAGEGPSSRHAPTTDESGARGGDFPSLAAIANAHLRASAGQHVLAADNSSDQSANGSLGLTPADAGATAAQQSDVAHAAAIGPGTRALDVRPMPPAVQRMKAMEGLGATQPSFDHLSSVTQIQLSADTCSHAATAPRV
jgi:hypothetical protein